MGNQGDAQASFRHLRSYSRHFKIWVLMTVYQMNYGRRMKSVITRNSAEAVSSATQGTSYEYRSCGKTKFKPSATCPPPRAHNPLSE
jgi:hypothetical protein